MPTIELMRSDYGGTLGVRTNRVFNLDAAVGHGAQNRPGDVMLVQAMLQGMAKAGGNAPFLRARNLSHPTGILDHITSQTIWEIQRLYSWLLLAVDGRIDPASSAGRKLHLRAQKKTMLQMFNESLSISCNLLLNNPGSVIDHTVWLIDLYPQLKAHVRDRAATTKIDMVA
jgi:hypothetical protein